MSPRVVVHGHFYQPPRHDPFTEAMPVEPSAAPFHDWNERINAEAYRPNGAARLTDGHSKVVDIVNNYGLLSFNVGPTLDSWLARHAPDTLRRMVAGDGVGRGAIAQPYHHVILPLSDPRDVRTEVRWGLAAFRHRFGREAEGIWLPETAVDESVLAVCVEEGVRFTILSPYQSVEPPAPGVVYRWDHPAGTGSMALVFYDGPLSHDVAFGAALRSGEELVVRAGRVAPTGLVAVATDGETFGHHHKFTERAIAHAFTVAAPRHGIDQQQGVERQRGLGHMGLVEKN
jgi:alpha-amylase/alpha-mannosidase (GH57 family)